ncbi:sulfatase-like hydrolase/transferase [Dehalobacter sp. DCM]|uniref:sulfatase-like hydrolase/transferase n=1 Tax=Dehalobacter sp. DCM TaxID=2907827 RepID=UPI0030816B27|nr:sulfatase-like hydrolase/transferase [Dehalobacter sp. DCM]
MKNKRFTAFIPLFILVLYELIYRGSFLAILEWLYYQPVEFILNYALIFGLINLFYIFPRRIYLTIGMLIFGFFSFVGLVCREKLLLRGEPLLPWDLSLGKEAFNVTQGGSSEYPVWFLVLLGAIVLFSILFIIKVIPRENYSAPPKVMVALLSFLLLFGLTYQIPLSVFDLKLIQYSQKSNYDRNGVLLGFMLNYKFYKSSAPEEYDQARINQIVNQVNKAYMADADFNPNVIFIQSEAFWDPTLLKTVTFSQDPIPYFHALEKNYTSGTMLVPVFGGGTVNTEFEILTGYSCSFLTPGAVSYVCYVDRQLDALPEIYKKQGYTSTAIHTYDNWFYRRNLVFNNLGFDKFISKEFFISPEKKGSYIRDTELTQRILDQVKQSDKPDFIYAISMEAHGPYSSQANPENTLTVQSNLTAESKNVLENYTNTLVDVDQSLKMLIDGLEAINEPTIVVFYGDHLPALGNNSEVYIESGYFQNNGDHAEYIKKYSVPFVIWDNFTDPADRKNLTNDNEKLRLSSNFLGSYVLEMSKKDGNTLTNFLYALYKEGHSVLANTYQRKYEELTTKEIAEYELLQYDTLCGEAYTYALNPSDKPTENTSYILGEGKPEIDKVRNIADNTIEIRGIHFLPDLKVYINGKPYKTTFVDSTLLSVSLAESVVGSGDMEIKLEASDSLDNIIMESNTYTFKRAAAVSNASE